MTPDAEARRFVVSVIADVLKIAPSNISDDSFLTELAPDSIALFELLIRFETLLATHIRYEDIASIESVRDVTSLVSKKFSQGMLAGAIQQADTPIL